MYLFMYLALVGECPYPILWTIIQHLIARDPKAWIRKANQKGDLEIMQYAVAQEVAQGNSQQIDWNECIAWAAWGGHMEIVQYAVAQGDPKPRNWSSFLAWAARGGHIEMVQYIAAQTDHQPIYWNTCIYEAAVWGHMEIVQYAIAAQRDPQQINWSWCALSAALGGHLEIVRYAVEHGDPYQIDWDVCMTRAINADANGNGNADGAEDDGINVTGDRRELIDFIQDCQSKYQK